MFRDCTGILMKGIEEISSLSTCGIIAVFFISTSHFSYVINGYLLTYLLIPWSRKLLENLTGSKLVNNSPAFLGNQKVHFLNNYNDEILISITVRPSETSYIEYTRMPSLNQHVTNLVVFQSGEFQVHL